MELLKIGNVFVLKYLRQEKHFIKLLGQSTSCESVAGAGRRWKIMLQEHSLERILCWSEVNESPSIMRWVALEMAHWVKEVRAAQV